MSENVKAGGAYVELTVRDKMKQGLDEAKNRFSSFGKQFTAAFGGTLGGVLAGLSLGSITAKIGEVLNMADEISEASSRVGLTSTAFQELSYAASLAKSSISEVSGGIAKFRLLIGQAELGNKTAIDTLNKYGLSLESLKNMSPDERLKVVADLIVSMPDDATRAAAAVALLGKSAVGMLPLLSGGAAGLEAMAEQANRLGLVAKPEDVERAANLADVWKTVSAQVSQLGSAVYTVLVPAFEKYAEIVRGGLASTIAFIHQNRGLVATMFAISAAFSVAVGVGAAYKIAVMGLSLAMPLYTAATYGATIATAAFNAAILANPVGAVVAAILAAAAAAVYFSGVLSGLGAITSQVFSGISDAIAGGNLELAWNIATTGMHLAWVQFGENVMKVWDSVINWVAQKMADMFNGFTNMLNGFLAKIEALRGLEAGAMGRINGEFIVSNPSNTSAAWADDRKRLQAELSDLKEQAAKEKAALNAPDKSAGGTQFDINSLMAKMGDTMKQSMPVFTTAATFNPNAVSSLASPAMRIQQDQLKELEKQTQLLEDVADGIDEPVGVFS